MKLVTPEMIARVLEQEIPQLAYVLPADVAQGLKQARQHETSVRAAQALDLLLENAQVAQEQSVPLCQDTGTCWVCLEVGSNIMVPGNIFSRVNNAVASAYVGGKLRKSVVKDALFNRENTQDNTPAFTDIHFVDEPNVCRLHVMLKGGGSDNASRVVMLAPGAGRAGIVEEVVKCVREKAANACPPLVVGVGVGGTFDKVAHLAKQALMRPFDAPAKSADHTAFEQELLSAINATGVGAAGFGGATTALAVHVETAPCHIAALPLAINMGCSAMRRATFELEPLEMSSFDQLAAVYAAGEDTDALGEGIAAGEDFDTSEEAPTSGEATNTPREQVMRHE